MVLKKMGELHGEPEGADLGWWVVLDYGTVIVHALQPEAREYYDLDRLYSECPELDWRAVELPDFQPADTAPASDPEALEARFPLSRPRITHPRRSEERRVG